MRENGDPIDSFGSFRKELEKQQRKLVIRLIFHVLSLALFVTAFLLALRWYGWKILVLFLLFEISHRWTEHVK